MNMKQTRGLIYTTLRTVIHTKIVHALKSWPGTPTFNHRWSMQSVPWTLIPGKEPLIDGSLLWIIATRERVFLAHRTRFWWGGGYKAHTVYIHSQRQSMQHFAWVALQCLHVKLTVSFAKMMEMVSVVAQTRTSNRGSLIPEHNVLI